jgi:prepilin-type N-terminal cleavage/methylation domain-containing protein
MTHPGLRFTRKDQSGFTLIEMLVVIGLIGIITGGITAAIMQVLTINTDASNHMIAVRQVQQAGKEVSKDTLQAQNVTCGGSGGFPLTLTWTDSLDVGNNATYTITDDNELQRSHNLDGVRVIARYIDSGQTSCYWDGIKLTFNVTATVGNGPYKAIETRVYEIEPRPG